MTRPIRVAILADFPEEGWASMDLTAEMIALHLARDCSDTVEAERICPPFRLRFTRLPVPSGKNIDRILNRFWDYPRALRRIVREDRFDLYHLADHSYSQLVPVIPPGRAIVTCHDLDTFRCLLEPAEEPRPAWFRAMARRILNGLQAAAAVVCNSETTRRALLDRGLIATDRLHVALMGTHPAFQPHPDPVADAEAARLLGPISLDPATPPDVLHVGSTIPRKRIDLLLAIFAAIRRDHPGARLIKAGGTLTPAQWHEAERLGVAGAIEALPFFPPTERATLAAVYRRAASALLPSEAEGFGLPLIEALACGTPMLASDLAALHEVGGAAATYQPIGDLAGWTTAARQLLADHRQNTPAIQARRAAGLARAQLFQWSRHAQQLAEIYRNVLN